MNNKIKNKIITISGEPVSGKGTAVRNIVEELKKSGYDDEKIHIISTGQKFRDYFEKIIEFIRNIDDTKKIDELSQNEELRELFEYHEFREILTRTISKIKNNNIDLDSIGKISELNDSEAFDEIRVIIDKLIDERTKVMGQQINEQERPDEVWIFDSRMAFNSIPEAFSVRLTASSKIAGERLFNDKTRGKEDRYDTVEEAEKEREERRIGEIRRYKDIYGIDIEDEENYDLIIDTTYAEAKDISKTILECEKLYREGKDFGKTWASSLTMIPSQTIIETIKPQPGSIWTLELLGEEIKEFGYDPKEKIEIFKLDGINFISEGHHRNVANLFAGNTLIPYIDFAKTDYGKKRIERGLIPTCRIEQLNDFEDIYEKLLRRIKGDESIKFYFKDIYPDILSKVWNPQER